MVMVSLPLHFRQSYVFHPRIVSETRLIARSRVSDPLTPSDGQNKIGDRASEFIHEDKQDCSLFANPQIHLWEQSKIQNPKSE
jgi:hypothetical protein